MNFEDKQQALKRQN